MGKPELEQVLLIKEHEDRTGKPAGNYVKLALHIVTSVLVVSHLAANFWYLFFKYSVYSKNLVQAIFSPWTLIILLCETAYFVSAIIVASHNLLIPRTRPPRRLDLTGTRYPTVDIFISCFKEPLDQLQDTISAALALDYPRDCLRLFVLDDGGDDDLRSLCRDLEETAGRVEYIRRIKIPGAPKDFKCGNMNNGLKHSDAEYVFFLDADMIAHPSILQRLLPYMIDSPDIGFVQTPQFFYNLSAGDPLDDANMVFQQMILPRRDQLDCASFLGTGAVFRRTSLAEIGGFQAGSVTEDTLTAYVLFNNGYRSVYVNEKLQAGLAPWTFAAYVEQRQRWAIGSMQQFGISCRDLLGSRSRISFIEKVWYVWHTTNHLLSIFNILLMFSLLSALAFRLPLAVTDDTQANHALMAYLGLHLVLMRISWIFLWASIPRGMQNRNRSEAYFWWMSPFYCRISLQALIFGCQSFAGKFLPTNSIDQASAGSSPLWVVTFHIAVALTSVGVVIYRNALLVVGSKDCHDIFYTIGLSLFLLILSANLLVPVMFILRHRSSTTIKRRSLLQYTAGVPIFPEDDGLLPTRDWSIIWYEVFGIVQVVFWAAMLIIYFAGANYSVQQWCALQP